MVGNQTKFVGIAEIEIRILREIGRALSEVSCVRPEGASPAVAMLALSLAEDALDFLEGTLSESHG
jgi:hypothetical protein